DFHPAPRSEDDVRVALDDRLAADDAVLGFSASTQLGEDRLAAGDLDEFFHPFDPADERIVPFFKEHARAAGKGPGRVCDALQLPAVGCDQLVAAALAA